MKTYKFLQNYMFYLYYATILDKMLFFYVYFCQQFYNSAFTTNLRVVL